MKRLGLCSCMPLSELIKAFEDHPWDAAGCGALCAIIVWAIAREKK